MTRRDNNPDRLDDGARAEAEMKEREAGSEATRYAERLATVLWEKHWKADSPQWKPLSGDLIGILTQIDNMTAGLTRSALPAPQGDDGLVGRLDVPWEATDEPTTRKINRFIRERKEAASALRSQAAEIAGLKTERDHWRDYSSGQGKLIESGVFVKNEEYMRLASAEAKLASAMEALTEAREFVDRHSESWYTSGQELLARIDTILKGEAE